ncbi:MAG: ADP-forming succinate--CoA ligase subunit beta [Alphaproteobacteria bacterium]|nr:ADP-forming succinate--CoA ligase subunit beta [Alphaproteobacteria bacterium]
MNIHEYQAKSILSGYGIPVTEGNVAYTPDEAVQVAKDMPKQSSPLWVVKAQIHAGGRGKAGGVILARSLDEVKTAADKLLHKRLITHQTDPRGQEVKRIYVAQGCDIEQELYLSLVLDRSLGKLTFIASASGGVDIEEVAKDHPEKVFKVSIDPSVGIQAYQARKLCFALNLSDKIAKQFHSFLKNLYDAYIETDASLIEINPLAITNEGDLIALDAKVSFDPNSLFRHPQIEILRDEDEEDPAEREAKKYDLSYVKLDGNIGCMVNGAGLAMATMDIIQLYGAKPANFLDVGGGADQDKVKAAFKLILADPNVEAILINIFGGIMRCDIIAEGIVAAAKETNLSVPIVVRLQGTNKELGKEILSSSHLPIIAADDLEEAAIKVVRAANETL